MKRLAFVLLFLLAPILGEQTPSPELELPSQEAVLVSLDNVKHALKTCRYAFMKPGGKTNGPLIKAVVGEDFHANTMEHLETAQKLLAVLLTKPYIFPAGRLLIVQRESKNLWIASSLAISDMLAKMSDLNTTNPNSSPEEFTSSIFEFARLPGGSQLRKFTQ